MFPQLNEYPYEPDIHINGVALFHTRDSMVIPVL